MKRRSVALSRLLYYNFGMSTDVTAPITSPSFTWTQKLVLSLGMPLLTLVILELACRAFNVPKWLAKPSGNMVLDMPTWMLHDVNARIRSTRLSQDPASIDWLSLFEEGQGYRLRMIPGISKRITNTFSQIEYDKQSQYLVQANSLGFRGAELTREKASGSFRILIFGDSSTFGWGVNQDEMYSSVLQRRLRELIPGHEIEVGNFAIPGDSSEYGKLVFDAFAPLYEADVIILGFGANDAKAVYTTHTSQVDKFRSNSSIYALNRVLRQSSLAESLHALLVGQPSAGVSGSEPAKLPVAVKKKRYQNNLKYMANSSLGAGSSAVVILNVCTPAKYAKSAGNLAREEGYLYLNGQRYLLSLLQNIKQRKVFPEYVKEMQQLYGDDLKRNELFHITSDGCHPNKLGHRLIGEALAGIIAGALSKGA